MFAVLVDVNGSEPRNTSSFEALEFISELQRGGLLVEDQEYVPGYYRGRQLGPSNFQPRTLSSSP
jgi:hypothetical protein